MSLADLVREQILSQAATITVRVHYQRTNYHIIDEARIIAEKKAKREPKPRLVKRYQRQGEWDKIIGMLSLREQTKAELNSVLHLNMNQIESILFRMRSQKLIEAVLVTPERGQPFNRYRLVKK